MKDRLKSKFDNDAVVSVGSGAFAAALYTLGAGEEVKGYLENFPATFIALSVVLSAVTYTVMKAFPQKH